MTRVCAHLFTILIGGAALHGCGSPSAAIDAHVFEAQSTFTLCGTLKPTGSAPRFALMLPNGNEWQYPIISRLNLKPFLDAKVCLTPETDMESSQSILTSLSRIKKVATFVESERCGLRVLGPVASSTSWVFRDSRAASRTASPLSVKIVQNLFGVFEARDPDAEICLKGHWADRAVSEYDIFIYDPRQVRTRR